MKKYSNLIIDTNQCFKAAFSIIAKQNLEAQDIIVNKTIHLSFLMILKLKSKYLNDNGKIYLLADNPSYTANVRKKLDPDYKFNRLKESDGYYRGIDYLLLLAQYYSDTFLTIRVKRLEADDLVPKVLDMCNGNSLLCSTDLDWARSMDLNVDWYSNDQVYDQESFKKKWKFFPNERSITLYKVFMGDESDSIPSISGINEQTTLNIINNFDTVYDLLSCIKKNTEKAYLLSDYTKKTILKNEDRVIKNYNLVYFCEVSNEEVSKALMQGSFNEKALSILYKSLNFPSNFDSRIEDRKISFGDIFSKFDEVNRR